MRALASAFVGLFVLPSMFGCIRHVVTPDITEQFAAEAPPHGTVEVNVVSGDEHQVWDVYVLDEVVCTTPCLRRFNAHQEIVLESRDGEGITVLGLGAEAQQARRALLVADGTWEGKQVNGIVWTTFGGMGVVTAITFTAIGCSNVQERPGTCTAGLITGAVSVPLTAFGIWMILDSLPKTHVLPVFKTEPAKGQPPLTLEVTPVGVAGTF